MQFNSGLKSFWEKKLVNKQLPWHKKDAANLTFPIFSSFLSSCLSACSQRLPRLLWNGCDPVRSVVEVVLVNHLIQYLLAYLLICMTGGCPQDSMQWAKFYPQNRFYKIVSLHPCMNLLWIQIKMGSLPKFKHLFLGFTEIHTKSSKNLSIGYWVMSRFVDSAYHDSMYGPHRCSFVLI